MTYLPKRPPTCTCNRALAVAAFKALVAPREPGPEEGKLPGKAGPGPVDSGTGTDPATGLDRGLMGGGCGAKGLVTRRPRKGIREGAREPGRDPWEAVHG